MIKIFSVHAKRTDFLKLHVESLRFFCKDEFEYFCIDNFYDVNQSKFLKEECNKLGVNYIKFLDYPISGSAWDHAPALNSIKTITDNDVINVVLEFDVFLINHFSFQEYIEGYHISGLYQQRNDFEKEYIAPFIIIVNKNSDFSLIDFGAIPGDMCDTGGNTRFYIPNKNVKWMNHTSALTNEKDSKSFIIDYDPSFGFQIIENCFLHYYRGSNWDQRPEDYEKLKTTCLRNVLNKSKECDIINHSYLSKYQTIFSHSYRYWNGSPNAFISKLNPYLNEN